MIAIQVGNEALGDVLATALTGRGHEVVRPVSRRELLETCCRGVPVVVALQVADRDETGVELCRALARLDAVRTLCLLPRHDVELVVRLLDAGAADCLPTTCDPREAVARLLALSRTLEVPDLLEVGNLRLDLRARQVHLDEELVCLTATEFDVLAVLAGRPSQVFTRRQLRLPGWAGEEATVTVIIRHLREKLEIDPSRPERLLTVRGVGYRLTGAENGHRTGEAGQRSRSPTTKKNDASTAATSWTRQPGSTAGSADTLLNDAVRIPRRHGVTAPRETSR